MEDKGPPIAWPALDRLPDVLLTAIVVLFTLLIVMLGLPAVLIACGVTAIIAERVSGRRTRAGRRGS